jgi:hypothetical protein
MVLGRFRLIEKVDACEAAASYTAVNGDVIAWLEVLETGIADTAIQRLKDQRTALAKVKRARAPELIEFGEEERRTFVAVRRQPGETLASRIRRGGLGAIETLELLIDLADALAEAHALGIVHGRLNERSIYFAAGGRREELEILGFGLAGLSVSLDAQPKPEEDLRAVGTIAYRCLAGLDALSADPPARVLEKQPHLPKEARDLVLRLLDGSDVDSAATLGDLARAAKKIATTTIGPVRPIARDPAKIEVLLRATIEAANAEDDESASGMEPFDEDLPPRPRAPSQPRGAFSPAPPAKMSPIDAKTLFLAGAILIVLILGLWIVTTSGGRSAEVTVEQIESE